MSITRNEEIARIKEFSFENCEIEQVEWIDAVKAVGANILNVKFYNPGGYYKVTMKLHPTRKSNIGVVVGLPDKDIWNGKFLGTGNGGSAGTIAEESVIGGVSRCYATANTDMGTTPNPDDCIGNEEVIVDFGYRATHLMTKAGQELSTFFYGKKPEYSYFLGGSTGGQQAFSEAVRYPEDYDGIICLSPAFDRIRLHTFFIWNWQQLHKNPDAAFTIETAAAWRKCIEKEYGSLCGNKRDENYLGLPHKVTENPMDNPRLMEKAKEILTEGQIRALREIYAGPKDPVTGEKIIAHFLPATETEGLSLVDMSDKETFIHGFGFPFAWKWGKDFDFMKFDFHTDFERAMEELSPILDSSNPDLSAFKQKGGKLLVIGGSSDAIIPYTGFLDYYEKVLALEGGLDQTEEYFRFFLMPGFAHTIGGNGVQEVGLAGVEATPRDSKHDVICAMEKWVEQDTAPEKFYGTHFKMTENGLEYGYDLEGYSYRELE